MILTSKENNIAPENLNDKHLKIMNVWGTSASYLLSPLSKITKLEHTSQFKLIRDSNSNGVSELLINKTIPVTLQKNLLTFS